MTDKPNTIYAALCKAQQAMTGATKDSNNAHFRSKYADLGAVQDACLPALHANGFAVYHPLVTDEAGGNWVETILAHSNGETLSCRVPLLLGDRADMQGLGSAITYARRYGLLCMSGVAPEDDDGNKAAEQGGKMPKPAPKVDEAAEKHEAACQHAIETIKNMTDIRELGGYWAGLVEEQKPVAVDKRVRETKDEMKAYLETPKTEDETE